MRIAAPAVGDLAQERVDVEFRGDVDAAGRLVEQQDPWAPRDRAGEHHLLLVAAAEAPDPLARTGRPESHAPAERRGNARARPAGSKKRANG